MATQNPNLDGLANEITQARSQILRQAQEMEAMRVNLMQEIANSEARTRQALSLIHI